MSARWEDALSAANIGHKTDKDVSTTGMSYRLQILITQSLVTLLMDFMKLFRVLGSRLFLLFDNKKQKNTGEPNLCNLSFPWLPPLSHHHQANPFPSLNPNPTFLRLPSRPQNLAFSSKPSAQTRNQDQSQNQDQTLKLNSPQPEKKSVTIATGERFLGFTLRPIKGRSNRKAAGAGLETSFLRDGPNVASVNGGGRGARYDTKERIGIVTEDEIELDVLWEQRIKDVEAERKRRVVTSPGFSFSAAGLLFPYHLGVAQCLIDKGYIKDNEESILADRLQDDPLNGFDVPVTDWDNEEGLLGIGDVNWFNLLHCRCSVLSWGTTPLAGSSAGAVVCAAIASGASMEEALMATKAVLCDVLEKFFLEVAHTRSNGRVRIAVTQILRRPRGLLVDQFDSKEDLINAVLASSFIPG
ncbi:hypothetical protein NL676_039503 [Syzygium grande]|nr:hypothetical protein NL676_039503 [Syzygium grande]